MRPTLVMDQHEWTAAHVEAFGFFGGVPGRLVPDNLKTGVDKLDLYDPKINRVCAELAAHCCALVDPARVLKPVTNHRWNGRCPTFGTRFGGAAVFAAVEAPALMPLSVAPFVLATWSAARVGPDIHAKVGVTLYSVSWRHIGDRLDARFTATMVQLFHHGDLVKARFHKDRGKQTDLGECLP